MRTRTLIALAALALAACTDTTEPGNASEEDRAAIISVLEESGWFDLEFAADGAAENVAFSVAGLAMDSVPPVRLWGRRFHEPTERSRNIRVAGDTAVVTWSVTFGNGAFLLDRTADDLVNPTSKPMDVTTLITAVLVRRADPDSAGRAWRLVSVSPARTVNTAEDERTVRITKVTVRVNGSVARDVTDANRRVNVDTELLDLDIGDQVTVTATVENDATHGNVPETRVFLHLFHARANAAGWARMPMVDNGDGTWSLVWTARREGRQRLIVDAIDSQTFATDADDDYRSEIWGLAYRIRGN